MEMMNCPKCGERNSAKREWCYLCEASLHLMSPSQSPEGSSRPTQGKPIRPALRRPTHSPLIVAVFCVFLVTSTLSVYVLGRRIASNRNLSPPTRPDISSQVQPVTPVVDSAESALRREIAQNDEMSTKHSDRADALQHDADVYGMAGPAAEAKAENVRLQGGSAEQEGQALREAGPDLERAEQALKQAVQEIDSAAVYADQRDRARLRLAQLLVDRKRRSEAVQQLRMVHGSQGGTRPLGQAARAKLTELGEW